MQQIDANYADLAEKIFRSRLKTGAVQGVALGDRPIPLKRMEDWVRALDLTGEAEEEFRVIAWLRKVQDPRLTAIIRKWDRERRSLRKRVEQLEAKHGSKR